MNSIPEIAHTEGDKENNILDTKDFFQAPEESLTLFLEAIQASRFKKVIVAIHPYFLEELRAAPGKPATKRYNQLRRHYLEHAAEAGRPVLIFEENSVLQDIKETTNRYNSLLPYKNVMFVRTLPLDPTPTTPLAETADELYERLFKNMVRYDRWTTQDWQTVITILSSVGHSTLAINPEDEETYPQYMFLRERFIDAFEQIKANTFKSFVQRLRILGAERVALGGSKYQHFDPGSGYEMGCVSYVAAELHRQGLPVHLSRYFAFPDAPTHNVRQYLRK